MTGHGTQYQEDNSSKFGQIERFIMAGIHNAEIEGFGAGPFKITAVDADTDRVIFETTATLDREKMEWGWSKEWKDSLSNVLRIQFRYLTPEDRTQHWGPFTLELNQPLKAMAAGGPIPGV